MTPSDRHDVNRVGGAGPTVRLRPLDVADVTTLVGWSHDPVLRSRAGWGSRPEPELVRFWRQQVEERPTELLRFAAVCDGALVGYVDLHGAEVDRRELGFLIGPSERWGRGLGQAAAAAGLRHGFAVLGLREVWAEADRTNAASVRILQRLGLQEAPAAAGPGPGADGFRRFAIDRFTWSAARGSQDAQRPVS